MDLNIVNTEDVLNMCQTVSLWQELIKCYHYRNIENPIGHCRLLSILGLKFSRTQCISCALIIVRVCLKHKDVESGLFFL